MKLGEYEIIHTLSPARSYLATDSAGQRVVLKLLPPDCLMDGRVIPAVADRLRRVRDIAMLEVANLHGMLRHEDRLFLVWSYVEGRPFDPARGDREKFAALLRRTVRQFHSTGLVHGALHEGNIIVDNRERIRLIDVSPLLFLDPARDEASIERICGAIPPATPASTSGSTVNVRPEPRIRKPVGRQLSHRSRAFFCAVLLLLAGLVIAGVVHRLNSESDPEGFLNPAASR